MSRKGRRRVSSIAPALQAIANLLQRDLYSIVPNSWMAAHNAHVEIELAPITQKSGIFYRHFIPLRKDLISVLAACYRRCFKLALAHPRELGRDPHKWTWDQIQPAVAEVVDWIREWYMLACDGENRLVRRVGSIPFVSGETASLSIPTTAPPSSTPQPWCAPSWLFGVSLAYFGFGPLKTKHVPARDSEQRLSAAHTRLLLKGAKRLLLWELGGAIETIQDEEIAASGAIPSELSSPHTRESRAPKQKGFEGLPQKALDLSRYMGTLTEKQRMAFSLRLEYKLPLTDVASRMDLDRKTAYEHIQAAARKIDHLESGEKRKAKRAESTPEE